MCNRSYTIIIFPKGLKVKQKFKQTKIFVYFKQFLKISIYNFSYHPQNGRRFLFYVEIDLFKYHVNVILNDIVKANHL